MNNDTMKTPNESRENKLTIDEQLDILSENIDYLDDKLKEDVKFILTSVQNLYNDLIEQLETLEQSFSAKLNDIQSVTIQNCFELSLLKASISSKDRTLESIQQKLDELEGCIHGNESILLQTCRDITLLKAKLSRNPEANP